MLHGLFVKPLQVAGFFCNIFLQDPRIYYDLSKNFSACIHEILKMLMQARLRLEIKIE